MSKQTDGSDSVIIHMLENAPSEYSSTDGEKSWDDITDPDEHLQEQAGDKAQRPFKDDHKS